MVNYPDLCGISHELWLLHKGMHSSEDCVIRMLGYGALTVKKEVKENFPGSKQFKFSMR